MAANTKVLVIAIDGAEPELLKQWAASGDMPAIRNLMGRGAWGVAESPLGLGSDATWFSFFSGVNAGKLGRYFPVQIWPGSYKGAKFTEAHVTRPPFWAQLSASGLRVAAIDMLYAPLARGLNGVQISDWLVHTALYDEPVSWPPDLMPEIIAKYGPDPVGHCDSPGRTPEEYRELRDKLVARVATKADYVCSLLDQGGWDLFMAGIADCHCAGHQLWHYHDPAHPKHELRAATALGDPLKDVYRAVDQAIERILEHAGPGCTVLLTTGPGMGPNTTANHLLDEMLRRIEGGFHLRGKVIDGARSAYRGAMPVAVRRWLRTTAEKLSDSSHVPDRRHRKYFAVPHNELAGAIRLNLVGREPNGKVRPGAEFEETCAMLDRELRQIINLENGRPIVREVLRTPDAYHGERLEDLPDLLVIWDPEGRKQAVGSPSIGQLQRNYPGNRTGDHLADGMFVACGPGIAAGPLNRRVAAVDFAPTILALFNQQPAETDGSVIAALAGQGRAAAEAGQHV